MRGVPILCWHHKDNKLRSIYRCIKSHDSPDARLVLSHLLSLLFMQPYVGAILPRAEWQQGNMKIVMGITSSGRIFISFLDEKALSHANLDEYFKQAEPTKAKVAW